ncbi:MAG: hypothetical protein WC891_00750 [Actinomycetota bacterium]
MKKITVIYVCALAASILLIAGVFAWNFFYGPAMTKRTNQAIAALAHAKKARSEAETALKTTAALPEGWRNLAFDETAELNRIAADLAANRQYKVDNYRDPAAAAVAKDIDSADKTLAKALKDLQAARRRLAEAQKSYLPASRINDLEVSAKENAATSRQVTAARSALKELKSDNYIWGHLAVVVKSDGEIVTAVARADAALKAADYAALQAAIADAKTSLADSIDWLQVGELELTNVGIYSKDTADLKRFISKAGDTAKAYEQTAIFMSGARADALCLKQATERASAQLTALQEMAEAQQIGQGYKVWFLAAANRHL